MIATVVVCLDLGAARYMAHLGLVRPRVLERLIRLVAAGPVGWFFNVWGAQNVKNRFQL
jgi:hypothetical protein